MNTLYQTNYRGFIIRIRKTGLGRDSYLCCDENYVAESWVYHPDVDMEELDWMYYGCNMIQAYKRLTRLIDTVLTNRQQ